MQIKVDYDSRELDVFLNNVTQKGVNKAVAKSLNRTAVTVRKETAQDIKKSLGGKIAIGAIKKAMPSLRKARGNESVDSQEEVIGAETKGLSLNLFRPKQIAVGVQFSIAGQTIVTPHAFVAKMKNAGKSTVFRRVKVRHAVTTRRGPKPNRSELPIEKQTYKSIYNQLPDHTEIIQKTINERFAKEFQSNFDHYVTSK